MLKDNGDIRADLFDKSGQHISRSGYELWKKIIAPHLNDNDIASHCFTRHTDAGARDPLGSEANPTLSRIALARKFLIHAPPNT
jgi:hypothetical protein